MKRRTLAIQFLIMILVISTVPLPGVRAEVSSVEVSPAFPSQGDVVTIHISAQPEEEVAVTISFSKTLSVVNRTYEWILDDVYVPSTPNRVSVRAENVEYLVVAVKIFLWITQRVEASEGIAATSRSKIPKGTYDLRIRGNATAGASEVSFDVIASATVKMDSTGSYDYSYNTSNIPIGLFTVEAGSIKKTVSLTESGSTQPPTEDDFVIGDLSVYPLVSSVDTEIQVSVMVSNTGERVENRVISFTLDGSPLKEENVSLEAGDSTYVGFGLPSLGGGWHILTVENSSRSFVVIAAQATDAASRVFEALKGIPSQVGAEILETVSPEDTSNETPREEDLETSKAVEVIEAAVELGFTRPYSTLLLNLEKDEGASLLISVDNQEGSALLQAMFETDPQGCAALVEAATNIEITGLIKVLELVETDLLSRVLLEIARLPSTPSTVTRLLEEMSPEKVMAVTRFWIGGGHLRELGLVLDEASEEMLNSVTENLEKEDQLLMLPHLLPETFAQIDTGLLTLPDLSVIDVSVDRSAAMRYLVTVDIGNTGAEPAGVDVTLTVNGSSTETFTVDEIQADEGLTVEFHWEPDAVGGYRIGALVDGDNDVFEINEGDNTGYVDVVVGKSRSWTGIYLVAGALVLAAAVAAYRRYR